MQDSDLIFAPKSKYLEINRQLTSAVSEVAVAVKVEFKPGLLATNEPTVQVFYTAQ